jgi:hypothetical protein
VLRAPGLGRAVFDGIRLRASGLGRAVFPWSKRSPHANFRFVV